ncbi:hypothetical protein C4K35_4728 [Pseudomonas chlororaphis subsp. piscium]|uniref:hypothetical protein n=1 Tax=Pseudomonas chlororaphis TaxID=587753 RepID=UPI000F6DFF9A|nr:hypothetical protein [Pseudomonas chlororaphis]AZC52297.1 hypothetical protein C4K35_4728 [Pseudomonas chlororaphis subsp. piscium]
MNVDKEKLKSLLWSVVASWKADDGDLLRHADALEELLGDKTVEEVALLLIGENERLEVERDSSKVLLKDVISRESQLKAENEVLLAALKGMASMYGYCWDVVGGGLLCMEQNVQRFEDAHEAAQKVIVAIGKGEQP